MEHRDIKFKAWDSCGKQMCEWKLHQNPNVDNDVSFMFVGENGFTYPWEHPDLIKLEFTGREDKNGNPIDEGDVCTFDVAANSKCMECGYLSEPERVNLKGVATMHGINFGWNWCENIVKIGNIYQNPELLK